MEFNMANDWKDLMNRQTATFAPPFRNNGEMHIKSSEFIMTRCGK
jgi:hypothetical protein